MIIKVTNVMSGKEIELDTNLVANYLPLPNDDETFLITVLDKTNDTIAVNTDDLERIIECQLEKYEFCDFFECNDSSCLMRTNDCCIKGAYADCSNSCSDCKNYSNENGIETCSKNILGNDVKQIYNTDDKMTYDMLIHNKEFIKFCGVKFGVYVEELNPNSALKYMVKWYKESESVMGARGFDRRKIRNTIDAIKNDATFFIEGNSVSER